jgi:RNA polymerase sigma factor (sigma-70 family)
VDDSESTGSVTALLERVRNGDAEAVRPLLQRSYPHALRQAGLLQRRVWPHPLPEEEVAQLAMLALWQGLQRGSFPRLAKRRDLVALLNRITRNKAVDWWRREGRAGSQQIEVALDELPRPDPSPEEEASLQELRQVFLQRLGPEFRPVARLLLDGQEPKEIAALLGCCRRTVERKAALIRDELLRWLGGDGPAAM